MFNVLKTNPTTFTFLASITTENSLNFVSNYYNAAMLVTAGYVTTILYYTARVKMVTAFGLQLIPRRIK